MTAPNERQTGGLGYRNGLGRRGHHPVNAGLATQRDNQFHPGAKAPSTTTALHGSDGCSSAYMITVPCLDASSAKSARFPRDSSERGRLLIARQRGLLGAERRLMRDRRPAAARPRRQQPPRSRVDALRSGDRRAGRSDLGDLRVPPRTFKTSLDRLWKRLLATSPQRTVYWRYADPTTINPTGVHAIRVNGTSAGINREKVFMEDDLAPEYCGANCQLTDLRKEVYRR
jgi:hypothetical protein